MSTSNELSVDPASPTGGDPNSYALVTLEQDKNAYIWAAIRQAECPKVKIVKELKSQNRVDPEKYWTKVESRSRPGVYYFFNRYTGECKWPAANYFSPRCLPPNRTRTRCEAPTTVIGNRVADVL